MTSSAARFLSCPRLCEVDRAAVAQSPADTWAFVRSTCPFDFPWMGAVVALQAAGGRLRRWLRVDHRSEGLREPQLIAGIGCDGEFPWLEETPGTEIVTGAIGRFWEPDSPLVSAPDGGFEAFGEPGYGKMLWSLQVHPRTGGGSWIGVELRADATDEESWSKLATYWKRFEKRSRTLRRTALRGFVSRLGTPPPERSRELAGDEFIRLPTSSRTDAVTIEAPLELVWPWLVQMGCGRAGWYSLDRLHNAGIRSCSSVRFALQNAKVGDRFKTSSRAGDDLTVLRLEPNRALVLGTPRLLHRPGAPSMTLEPDDAASTWAFVLDPIGDMATRLLARLRVDEAANPLDAAVRPFEMAEHDVMQRLQLRNLKWRAEALERSRERERAMDAA